MELGNLTSFDKTSSISMTPSEFLDRLHVKTQHQSERDMGHADVDVDLREIYFLIMHFLSAGPCQRTFTQFWNELLEYQLLPKRYHAWYSRNGEVTRDEADDGISFPLSNESVAQRYSHIEKDHLVKLMKQLILNVAPSRGVFGRTAPTAADIPTLLGIGPFSLLGCTQNEVNVQVKTLPAYLRWSHMQADQVRGIGLREIGGGFPKHHRAPSIRFACYAIAKPSTMVQKMQNIKKLRGHRDAVYCGLLKNNRWSLLKQLLILFFVIFTTDADLSDNQMEAQLASRATVPFVSHDNSNLPLSANLPLFHKTHRRHLSSHGAPALVLAPAQPPNYRPFVTSAHPPSSLHLSKPSMKKSGMVPPVGLTPPQLADIAPSQSGPGKLPIGLAQPPLSPRASNCCGPETVLKRGSEGCHCVYPIKLDILLLNVSSNPDWNIFLQEFATQLGLRVSQIELINFYLLSLSRLNISMYITPHSGIGFTISEASGINSSLSMHKVHLDPNLVGGYELLNLTWFKPVAPAQAPDIATSPAKAPPYKPSTPISANTSNRGKHLSLVLVFGIGAGILAVAIICVLLICLCASRKRKPETLPKETAKPRTVNALPTARSFAHPTSTRLFAYEELREATNNFEHACILGEGGFGKVFKGVLNDGTQVAIKRLSTGGQQGDKEFLVEVEMLSRLHHRNLVKLVGYFSNRDASQNLLCYELVPNGTLEAWLHGPLGVNCPLDWDTRMKIALDAARGLAYLHEDSQPCVIHRDFKASNILLENDFHAKVADFGLAKQAPEGRATYLSTRVMGTFGYVAPEYAMTGHLLVKSDVYSYGVVLLELLTGRKPVDMTQPSGQENLVTWARPILRDKDRLEELADEKLGGKYPIEDFIRVCTIAAACVAPEASQRPTMGEVVQSLKMVQRVTEYQDSAAANARPSQKQSSTTFESDEASSIFSSGPYSGLSAFDHDNISRTAMFSEDLHEGR